MIIMLPSGNIIAHFVPLFPAFAGRRQSVVYPEVTVYYMKETGANVDCSPAHCDGKTVYKYDIYEPGPAGIRCFLNILNILDNLLYYVPQPFRYNLLKEQLDYRSSGQEYRLGPV